MAFPQVSLHQIASPQPPTYPELVARLPEHPQVEQHVLHQLPRQVGHPVHLLSSGETGR